MPSTSFSGMPQQRLSWYSVFISPQVMPSVRAVRAPTCRVRAQLCLRGALTALYTVVSMLF